MAEGPGRPSDRARPALLRMLEHAPHSGGLALRIRIVDGTSDGTGHGTGHGTGTGTGAERADRISSRAAPAGPEPPASTDGETIVLAPSFGRLGLAEQTGWLAHAVLHVALRHPQRFLALRERDGQADLALFNLCADAIVDTALDPLGWLSLPAQAVRLDRLLAECLGRQEEAARALLDWDVERLYRAIDDRRIDTSGVRRDGPRTARARVLAAGRGPDLLPDPSVAGDARAQAERAHDWSQRLLRAQAGDGDQALLRGGCADLPHPRTPWEQVLRVRLARALAHEPAPSWSRPSRRWLALRGGPPGLRVPWEPGRASVGRVPRVALVVDTSGSIDDALLARFAAEIGAIVRRASAEVVLVVGDDAVRHVEVLAAGRMPAPSWRPGEGGGTDFTPLLREADRHRPDIGVVLTDLQGPATFRPGWPLLWAVPAVWAHARPPFGRRLVID